MDIVNMLQCIKAFHYITSRQFRIKTKKRNITSVIIRQHIVMASKDIPGQLTQMQKKWNAVSVFCLQVSPALSNATSSMCTWMPRTYHVMSHPVSPWKNQIFSRHTMWLDCIKNLYLFTHIKTLYKKPIFHVNGVMVHYHRR